MGEFTSILAESVRNDESDWDVFWTTGDLIACEHSEGDAKLIAAAFNAATAVEALGYDGQDAVEKLPEMVEALISLDAANKEHEPTAGPVMRSIARQKARAALPKRLEDKP